MHAPSPDNAATQSPKRTQPGLRMVGLGLGLLAGVSTTGCGLGTDPTLLGEKDGGLRDASATTLTDADAPAPGADAQTWVPEGIPPIDEVAYDATSLATFALG